MDPELAAIMWQVYRGYAVDIPAALETTTSFTAVGNPAGNASALAALNALVPMVVAKRSDDGLRVAEPALAVL